ACVTYTHQSAHSISPLHDALPILTRRVAAEAGDLLTRHGRAFYCSLHTTAGYLHHSLLARLHHRSDRLDLFFGAFRALFPPGGADLKSTRLNSSHDQISYAAFLLK